MNDTKKLVIIVGGGLAGLATAAYLAKAGRPVTVLERSKELGGRADTHVSKGYFFNLGPHALYAKGAGRAVLDELGVEISGHAPPTHGLFAVRGGERHVLPAGPGSLFRTTLLPWRDKLEILKLLATLPKLDISRFETLTIREWLDRKLSGSLSRELVEALLRLSTYANTPEIAGVRSALAQLRLGVHGAVLYLDGGWRTIVSGLGTAARNAGAHVETSCAVAALEEDSVVLDDGRKLKASAIVLAVAPFEVARLTGHVTELEPIRAACLDVALSRLPDPTTNFALGIDEPLYLSVHSSVAKLAPSRGALIHVARYLAPGEIPDVDAANRLEALLDLMQPGWRDVVVEKRFLPKMTVTHALVPPGGRPTDVDMLAMENVYVTGDWVGPVGMLSDTSLASARRVAERLGAVETKAAA